MSIKSASHNELATEIDAVSRGGIIASILSGLDISHSITATSEGEPGAVRQMNAKLNREPVVIDQSLVVGDFLFFTHRDRCLYIGTSASDQPHWLEANSGKWRRIDDVQQEAAPLAPPAESEIKVGAAPAGPNDQTASHDVRKDGDDESDVTLVDTPVGDASPPYQPTPLPVPGPAIVKGTTKAELLPPAKAAMRETKGPKAEATALAAMGRKQGRSGGRQPKKQKLPAEVSKAGRKLSPKRMRRMRIVLDSLREYPVLWHAAGKAGIHRKTLEYWIKRSAAGDDGYDIEWQGEIWKFHEHCQTAIEEAHDKPLAAAWDIAMGGLVYKNDELLLSLGYEGPDAYLRDENGDPVVETIRNPNGKMLRFYLEWRRPEKWGKRPKIDVPQRYAASIKARQWKSRSRRIWEAKP